MIYVVIATTVVSALLISEFVPPVYEARAVLYIPAKLEPVSYMAGGSTSTLARDHRLRAHGFLVGARRQFGLDLGFAPLPPTTISG